MPLPRPLPALVGVVLSRAVVPVWVLGGAIFKLIENTPRNLPPSIVDGAVAAGIDLFALLWVLVAIELAAAGVMMLMGRWARGLALLLLGAFCLVLIVEMAGGNFTSCGCFGNVKMPPWAMFLIDASLLAGILLSRPRATAEGAPRATPWPLAAAGIWTVVAAVGSGVTILGDDPAPPPSPIADGQNGAVAPDPGGSARQPVPLPKYHVTDTDSWIGKRWEQIPLVQFMPEWPENVDQGRRYVIFFGRGCEHCHEMFELHFFEPAPVPTSIIAVPESRDGFDPEAAMDYFCADCVESELPMGCDWIITTPVVIALEDGVVKCAMEGDDPVNPECLIWH